MEVFGATATGQGGGSAIAFYYARRDKHINKETKRKPEKKELETNVKCLTVLTFII